MASNTMMESSMRASRVSKPHTSKPWKPRQSGYEPSDTETEWNESPWNDHNEMNNMVSSGKNSRMESAVQRSITPINNLSQRHPAFDFDGSDLGPERTRITSKSPYKPQRDISPLPISERRRHVSPYKYHGDENNFDSKTSQKTTQHHRRSVTAPRLRVREDQPGSNYGHTSQRRERPLSPVARTILQHPRAASHKMSSSVGELNEMIANVNISKGFPYDDPILHSTESISPGNIFFSKDQTLRNNMNKSYPGQKPEIISQRDSSSSSHQQARTYGNFDQNGRGISSGIGLSTTISTSAVSRQSSSKVSTGNSKMSDSSVTTTASMRKFTENRRKSQSETWFGCIRKGPCRTSKSPEKRAFDEASFIEKAFVVENLRQFWADKYRPSSLNGFICNNLQTQFLRDIVSYDIRPHILFKGPPGSGKKALIMAFLREVFGDASWNVSHDLRYFQIQERTAMQIVIPITSSTHHLEINVSLEPNAKYALMGLAKKISSEYDLPPEASNVNLKANYKVMVLHGVEKADENIQHLIKWIMDCHSDTCKLILCCEDDIGILESVKNRCQVVEVNSPGTKQIIEVLLHIAGKEEFDLPRTFAAKIAANSKSNLRKAIMALEASKAHNYPFVDDQPIPIGWEEVLSDLSSEILADPSHSRLFLIQERIQKLLLEFVQPTLILQKLVEEFLKRVEAGLKRELYYWNSYYSKRLPTGISALPKIEEFVAKFMSIYRKSSRNINYM